MKLNQLCLILMTGIFLPLLVLSCSDDDDDDDLLGNWVRMSDFDGAARGNAAAFSIGEKGYLCTGWDGRDRLNDLWEYDSQMNYWIQKASLPATARHSATAFSIGSKGYVCLGNDGYDHLNDLWEYDPEQNLWSQKSNFPGTPRYGAVGFSVGDRGIVGSGYDRNHLKDFYSYNLGDDSWEQIPFPGMKRLGASVFVIGNNAYLVGGANNEQLVYDFWMFNGDSFTWEQKRDIANTSDDSYDDDYTISRAYGVAFSINSLGYFTTGERGALNNNVWEYNIVTDLWQKKTSFEGAARSGAVAFSLGSTAFVATGRSSSYRFDDLYEFHPFEEYNEKD
jgi:N-acetylneuraminic acid mutarotase